MSQQILVKKVKLEDLLNQGYRIIPSYLELILNWNKVIENNPIDPSEILAKNLFGNYKYTEGIIAWDGLADIIRRLNIKRNEENLFKILFNGHSIFLKVEVDDNKKIIHIYPVFHDKNNYYKETKSKEELLKNWKTVLEFYIMGYKRFSFKSPFSLFIALRNFIAHEIYILQNAVFRGTNEENNLYNPIKARIEGLLISLEEKLKNFSETIKSIDYSNPLSLLNEDVAMKIIDHAKNTKKAISRFKRMLKRLEKNGREYSLTLKEFSPLGSGRIWFQCWDITKQEEIEEKAFLIMKMYLRKDAFEKIVTMYYLKWFINESDYEESSLRDLLNKVIEDFLKSDYIAKIKRTTGNPFQKSKQTLKRYIMEMLDLRLLEIKKDDEKMYFSALEPENFLTDYFHSLASWNLYELFDIAIEIARDIEKKNGSLSIMKTRLKYKRLYEILKIGEKYCISGNLFREVMKTLEKLGIINYNIQSNGDKEYIIVSLTSKDYEKTIREYQKRVIDKIFEKYNRLEATKYLALVHIRNMANAFEEALKEEGFRNVKDDIVRDNIVQITQDIYLALGFRF